MKNEPIISPQVWQQLQEIAGDDAEGMLAELVDMYLEDAPKILVILNKSMLAQDFAQLQKSAHALRSPSASLGALRLAKLCQALEDSAKLKAREQCITLMGDLQKELTRVFVTLQKMQQV
jgi:HPt (histidine-containing phosphotransfer) domain-containing protein